MIFLDSDTLSYYFSGNSKIYDKVADIVKRREKIALTAINKYEILKGLRWRKSEKKEALFNEFLENITIVSIDDSVINTAADIYADLRNKGITIGDADILIAAIVINNNGILISNNTVHYEGIKGLNLENWLE